MKLLPSLVITVLLLAPSCLARIFERDTPTGPPACSLLCVVSIVPQFCDVTDTQCLCTNTTMSYALEACVYEACTIPENLLFVRYGADTCGVVNDKSRQREQYYLAEVLLPLATLFILARVFARIRLEAGLWLDDYLMIAAWVAYVAMTSINLVVAIAGFGQHIWYLSADDLTTVLEFLWIGLLVYVIALTLTKLSLLFFFRRIFPGKGMRHATLFFALFVILSNTTMLMVIVLECVPLHAHWTNWQYKVAPVQCLDAYIVVQVSAALGIFQDIVIMVMPLPILWKLNLPWKKKANLLVMFMVGLVVIICSSLRIPSLIAPTSAADYSWDAPRIAIWTSLEVSVGIICGCLPAVRSLIAWLFPNMSMTQSKNSNPSAGYVSSDGYVNSRSRQRGLPKDFIKLGDRSITREISDESKLGGPLDQHSEIDLVPYDGKRMGTQTVVQSRDLTRPDSFHGDRGHINITTDISHEQERL